jgi:excisionase family DNA binding protein
MTTTTPPATRQPGSPWTFLEAAEHLKVSDRHLRRLADEGKLRTIRFGRRRLIPAIEVERVARDGA